METLFGVPINQLMLVLLVIFGIILVVMAWVAMKNPLLFKLALRNPPRRRSQSALIVLGLMFATLLFSATFTTGDTLTHSGRVQALKEIGEIDVLIQTEARQPSGQPGYFDEALFQTVRDTLADTSEVAGVAPLVTEIAPIIVPSTGLNEAQVSILGYDDEWMNCFDQLEKEDGSILSLSSLTQGQVFVSSSLAEELDLENGDPVSTFFGSTPVTLTIAGTYSQGANPSGDMSLVMPLTQLQGLTGSAGKINSIIITNQGDPIKGAQHTDTVLAVLEPVLETSILEATPVKQEVLDVADEMGSTFSTIFLMFGQFSIAAGILLIFLIFIMLAAERKSELGITRAVGAYRGHIIRMFAFEGAIYALIAGVIGSLLGVVAGWGMVQIIGSAFGQADFELAFAFSWKSLVLAYIMGTVLTFIIVMISSWRVSRLNIVRAIRDIPEPKINRKTIRGWIIAILLPVSGILIAVFGLSEKQLSLFMLGVSLVIIGVPLLGRKFRFPDRAAFTIAGLGLVVWWLLPNSVIGSIMPDVQPGMEMFFLSGVMLVIGAVWAVIYNTDILLGAIVRIFGGIKGLPPVLKIAISYPMHNRFRTGITLAMFSLVVFTIVMMAFMINSMTMVFGNTERLSGGFDIRANASYANPIADIKTALQQNEDINIDDFQSIGSLNGIMSKLKQVGIEQDYTDFYIQGADSSYTETITYEFDLMAAGYNSNEEVWQALREEPGTAVVSPFLVPSTAGMAFEESTLGYQLEGFYIEDESIPEVFVQVQNPLTGQEERLRVIGVLNQEAFYISGIITSQETVNSLFPQPVVPLFYMFQVKDGVDAEAIARALEVSFVQHGMQTKVMAEEIEENAGVSQMMNILFQGFMGLGLLVGIAALGVIAARSVVERRKQIGVLRALGFQKSMVQFSFLLESSFIALLGIGLGALLGAGLSVQIIDSMKESFASITYQVPWINIIIVVIIAYGASLLTTYLPARQAAKIYPAEALRFE